MIIGPAASMSAGGRRAAILCRLSPTLRDRELPMPTMIRGKALWRSQAGSTEVLFPNDIIVRLYQED